MPVTYSRLQSTANDAVSAFSLTKPIFTGGEYADPNFPFHASIGVPISSIPGGPRKGDIINVDGTDYLVMEISPNLEEDWADLKLRRKRDQ